MKNKSILISPLRYPGSKRNLVPYIANLFDINQLHPELFVEPFVGGGSVFINLLQSGRVQNVIINDLDPWITSFWNVLFSDTNWLLEQIENIEVTIQKWYEYKGSDPETCRDQAITCLFLNRTSFSGILEKRAGPVGGKNQRSSYKIDCRFTSTTRKTLINRIQQISKFRDRIVGVWKCPWEEVFSGIRTAQKENKLPTDNLFFYLDPPFFYEAEALYRHYFLKKDHILLRDHLLTLQDKWLLSYDMADQVQALYGNALTNGTNGAQHNHVKLRYTLARKSQRKNGEEVLISNLPLLPANN